MKNIILNFILKRYTDYGKLKKENELLNKDIYTLVVNKDTTEGSILLLKYQIKYGIYELSMKGEGVYDGKPVTFGFFDKKMIKNEK